LLSVVSQGHEAAIRRVEATEQTIEVSLDLPEGSGARSLEVCASPLLPHESLAGIAAEAKSQGAVDGVIVRIPRYQGGRDLAYSRFQLVDAQSGEPLGGE